MRFGPRVVATAATLPLVLGLTACGGDQRAQPVAQLDRATLVPAMKEALARQTTWRVDGKITAGGDTLLTMSGVQQVEPSALSMEMSGSAVGDDKAKMIVTGGRRYLQAKDIAPDGKYLAIEPDDPAAGELGSLADISDPTKTFEMFGKALSKVEFVGTEAVSRRKLSRYAVTVDTTTAFEAQGKPVPADAPKTITYDIWIDPSGLTRKMSFTVAYITTELTMDDFNESVSIEAPPASDIITR